MRKNTRSAGVCFADSCEQETTGGSILCDATPPVEYLIIVSD